MEETSPVNYAMVVALSPVIVLLMSAALHREKITAQKGLGVTLGVAGALVVVLGAGFGTGGRNNLLGLLYAFLSVAGYAVYLMISGAVAQKYRAATIMKWLFLFTSLMLLPFGFKAIPEEPLLNVLYAGRASLCLHRHFLYRDRLFPSACGAQKASGDDGKRVLQPAAHCGVGLRHLGGAGLVQLG